MHEHSRFAMQNLRMHATAIFDPDERRTQCEALADLHEPALADDQIGGVE